MPGDPHTDIDVRWFSDLDPVQEDAPAWYRGVLKIIIIGGSPVVEGVVPFSSHYQV